LKGIEVLPLKEATDTIAASEAAAAAVQTAISSARTFIASKNLEIKKFGEAASKPAADEFTLLTERINAAAAKLGQFRKDTEARKKTAQMQEAGERMNTVDAEVKKMGECVEPFQKKEGEEAAPEVPEEACEKLVTQLNTAQTALDETRTFLAARQKEVKGNASHEETLKGLTTRLTEAQKEMAKHRKFASGHEQKYLAKKVLIEANEKIDSVQGEVKKATDFCAPLLEEGGLKYLVAASARTLADALRDHMQKKELTQETLYQEINGGGSTLSQDVFVAYLEKLPEASGHEEVAFTEERRAALFKHINVAEDGSITLEEFKAIFKQTFTCIKEISVTDVFDIATSKTVAKVEAGGILETEHGAATDAKTGMTRIECTVKETGKTGFVTVQGSQGSKFLDLISPFFTYCKEMDKVIEASAKAVGAVSAFFNDKTKSLQTATKDSPLAEARVELSKLRSKVSAAQGSLNSLKMKAAAGKKDFAKKEAVEKNAHIEAKEQKAADALIAPAASKVEAMEAEFKALEEASKPLTSLSGAELDSFASPVTVLDQCEKIAQTVEANVEAAKKVVSEQQAELPKQLKGPMLEAKKSLASMVAKAADIKKKATVVISNLHKKCEAIVEGRGAEVSGLLRAEARKKDVSAEQFFSELLKPGDERVSEEGFCSYISGLLGEAYKAEQVTLLCRHIDCGGIGKRKFQAFLQTYFVVVKGIAITDDFEISKAKTIRKADAEEVIELLEGPKADDKLAVQRIKGKSLKDGIEGWISLKGNQGTPFLQEVEKPYYTCSKEVNLEREFKTEGEEGVVRALKADEVLELIEGPRKETFEPGVRVKGKANSDGALGWFTVRDKAGTIFAEADGKYYACTNSVAMTDNQDIKECKVIRKLAVGELFTVEEGPIEEKEAGITRVKGKALKDDQVGWITVKGNAGTTFAEASAKHFCILKEVPLTKKFPTSSAGEEVRVLAKGEAMQVLEGPKEEQYAPEVRVKVKALGDGQVGWMTLKGDNVKPWTPYYKCKAAAPMHKTLTSLQVAGAELIREIAAGENVELMEGPKEDGKDLRMQARAEKDGALGWVTIRDAEGKRFFTV